MKKSRKEGQSSSEKANYSPLAYLKRPYFKRSRVCPLAQNSEKEINYKNKALLLKFVSEYGRILPSRITSVSAKKQRMLASAIKKARYLAILPYCDGHM